MGEPVVSNVSDTARWVAVHRARESARPDALFRDPFAERLAGARGKQIAEALDHPKGTANGWPLVTRTKLIDELVLQAVADGCDAVLNLAAGLDARPYRLKLPASLQWIEADLPGITEEKERTLAGETPVCRLRRVKVDLLDGMARNALFDEVAGGAARVLVLTEGLLLYLETEQVRSLVSDLLAQEKFRFWIADLYSPVILSMLMKGMGQGLANAPMKFAPPNGVAFFEELGWKVRELHSLYREGVRLKRVPFLMRWGAWFKDPDPRKVERARWSAIVRFEQPG